ncbi:leucine--tRNA ligase [Candidatus Berkelbacteria bacterium RIFCSPLOWO2_01_FULL_50_28]|uniref:Leucine--tRNA ligase n=1 Tax=Candidatus Berkelbacteria bacterium RIFCSPLOWO2_01_FULL_50_28 TaxID=1797471 RepID=A0A1F5EC79_9BACT|nr:MAG: leucine--tRNA ligase [Candidatus Berkelbacteria bacterium RIFCSPHIGHO2_01_FULL_50_36]OGD62234.1 MAG: leucine--tRNA ligase [Candidatus Berkelbacteria bacterium RIFCSPHIGHO2_12_FULL_50_11]OGD64876.1 MAG: leucine--tRNA ligase [Candidatus Berkelbacteria bacterium RIFCSPLOWO2_01_FULL_50_28]
MGYNHKDIEHRWRPKFDAAKLSTCDLSSGEPFYCLDMFPYPSGDGLHVGHWRGYTLSDFYVRYWSLKGKNVLHPMGFDAFGLPAENAAIKSKTHPKKFTDRAIETFKTQLNALGALYDWKKQVNTSSPDYYRWTQWLFLQFFKHGLAEKRQALVNWCPKDQTVLANEQVVGGCCERCGSKVTKKSLSQWYLKITDFTESLLSGLDTLDWPEHVKALQRNWIGRSDGATVKFHTEHGPIEVFTTRLDTIYGVSAILLAPEHSLVEKLTKAAQEKTVQSYLQETLSKSDLDRQMEDQTKTGVFTGSTAIHPFSKQELPIWVADYVLPSYGTGAVMLVPAHDKRDHEFATAHNLPILSVIEPEFIDNKEPSNVREDLPFVERDGIVAIVKHWSEDKYLGLKWKKVAWGTWITGGIEKGQSPEEAATSEILEEVGYNKLRLVKNLGRLHSKFYHGPKSENRSLHGHCLYFELTSDEMAQISDEEVGKHEPIWLSKGEVEQFMTADAHKWAWRQLQDDPALYEGSGYLTNSGRYDGLSSDLAAKKIADDLAIRGIGGQTVSYHLRDWLVSRQRYWGCPIPIVYDPKGYPHAVKDEYLPLLLPTDVDFQPGGESPIARSKEYAKRAEKFYSKGWHFDTDTLDTFVDSSWYYLRYLSPRDDQQAFDKSRVKKWLPVDLYIGGIEHAVLHLLYSRFVFQFLSKFGYVDVKTNEPFKKLFNIGMVTLHGAKMSKSKGNVISPDPLIDAYGTDALRGYELFLGPVENDAEWSGNGINGIHRFLIKLEKLSTLVHPTAIESQRQRFDEYLDTINKMIQDFRLNTVISEGMKLINTLGSKVIDAEVWRRFLVTISPMYPYLSQELYASSSQKGLIIEQEKWPEKFHVAHKVQVIKVLFNQKFVGSLEADKSFSETNILELISHSPAIAAKINKGKFSRTIYKPGELINLIP